MMSKNKTKTTTVEGRSYREHVLVVRLSALGDVAILAPVVRNRAEANPDVLFTIAAPKLLQPLFDGLENVRYLPTRKQKSRQLYKFLAQVRPTVVADMHRINRIVGADLLFLLHGVPVHAIRKYHCARHRMVRQRRKDLTPLPCVSQRYEAVFDACKLKGGPLKNSDSQIRHVSNRQTSIVGIAPFAQHQGKVWPLERMEQLVLGLSSRPDTSIVLFGGAKESDVLQSWADKYPHVESIAGKFPFEEELKYIQNLDVMVSMDSANMHFASCFGIPVVSIWGATHPNAGFYGWNQNPEWAVQSDLACRPCSAYGNKPCRFGDFRCMKSISVDQVRNVIETVLK